MQFPLVDFGIGDPVFLFFHSFLNQPPIIKHKSSFCSWWPKWVFLKNIFPRNFLCLFLLAIKYLSQLLVALISFPPVLWSRRQGCESVLVLNCQNFPHQYLSVCLSGLYMWCVCMCMYVCICMCTCACTSVWWVLSQRTTLRKHFSPSTVSRIPSAQTQALTACSMHLYLLSILTDPQELFLVLETCTCGEELHF